MQSGTRAHAQPPPTLPPPQFTSSSSLFFADPYATLMNQMTAISQRQSGDTAKILANHEEIKNTLAYVCYTQ